jgi:FkbM family methyltransferase
VIGQMLAKLFRILLVPQYRRAFLRTRVAASIEHDAVLYGLGLETVVDIGASRGQFALCIRRLYPTAQIYSFEPLDGPAGTWLETFAGDTRAKLFHKAVAAQAGPATMHVARWDVSSSLLSIGAAQIANFPFTEEASQQTVSTVLLSDCIDPAQINGRALLKLDVQGSELSALQGCADLLPRFEFVYVEASFIELYVGQALAADIVAFMLSMSFELRCVANLSHGKSRRPIQADFLFSRATAGPRRVTTW